MKTANSNLSAGARSIVLKALGIKSFSEVADKKHVGLDAGNDIDVEKAKIYASSARGSVRLGTLMFYTLNEFIDRIRKIKALKLPE